jgi:hypothetical protein
MSDLCLVLADCVPDMGEAADEDGAYPLLAWRGWGT